MKPIAASLVLFVFAILPTLAQETTLEPELTAEPTISIDYAVIPQMRLDDGAFVLGDEAATLTVVIFSDFLCAGCRDYSPTITQFINEYVAEGLARIEYRLTPVTAGDATRLAQFAECAGEQSRFWESREWLFQQSEHIEERENDTLLLPEATTNAFSQALDINEDMFAECLESAEQHLNDTLLATELDVIATPAVLFRINNSEPRWIQIRGQVFRDGGLPYELLELAVEAINR